MRVPDNFSQTERGVLWQSSTPHCTILGTISEGPGSDSGATWVNNSRIAVGWSEENTSHGFVQVPVIFTPNGIVDLGVKNASKGIAVCINHYGQVVGNLTFPAPSFTTQAFLYQNGVMQVLANPVPNFGYGVAVAVNDGWNFSYAFGINNQGAIIGLVTRKVTGTMLYRSALQTPVNPHQQGK